MKASSRGNLFSKTIPLCKGISPVTGEVPSPMASNAESDIYASFCYLANPAHMHIWHTVEILRKD